MEPELKFKSLPYGFAYCLDGECKHAEKCLRFLASKQITTEQKFFSIINPACTMPQTDSCPFFKKGQIVRYALGISRLFDGLPHNKALAVKRAVYAKFSKGTLYRIQKKVRLITPEEQNSIRKVFIQHEIGSEPLFDEYIDRYV